jgi:hypothetical protein
MVQVDVDRNESCSVLELNVTLTSGHSGLPSVPAARLRGLTGPPHL